MKETTVHLSEEEFLWVKSKGNNYLRHLVQYMMFLEDALSGRSFFVGKDALKGAGE